MTSTKCAHEGCNCQVPPHGQYGKYCSEHCKDAAGMTQLRCGCPHPECRAPSGT
jgi:hypothetical protein